MKFSELTPGSVFTQHDVKYIKTDVVEIPYTHGLWVESNRPSTIYNAIDLYGSFFFFEDTDYCEQLCDLNSVIGGNVE